MSYLSPPVVCPKHFNLVPHSTGFFPAARGPRPAAGSQQRWTVTVATAAAVASRRGQKLVRRALGSSPWEVLGVAPGATPQEIKKAYRRKALKEHPDVSKLPDAKQRWQELSAAYDALNDPVARKS